MRGLGVHSASDGATVRLVAGEDPPARLRQVGCVAETSGGVLLEEPQREGRGALVESGPEETRVRRRLGTVGLGEVRGVLEEERQPTRQHLEKDDAEGVEVGRGTGLLAPGLFRRDVLRGPQDGAGRTEPALPRDVRETEVDQLDEVRLVPSAEEEDVVGLHVPVDDAELVRPSERGGHLLDDLEALARAHRAGGDPVGEPLPDEELHHEVDEAIVRLAVVVDLRDVRVVDAIRGARLPEEPGPIDVASGPIEGEDLDRELASDENVPRAVDDAERPGPDPRVQAVSAGDESPDELVRSAPGVHAQETAATGGHDPPPSIRGNRSSSVVPAPGSLRMRASPFIRSMSFWTIARPMPEPSDFVVKSGEKTCGR